MRYTEKEVAENNDEMKILIFGNFEAKFGRNIKTAFIERLA